MKKVYLIAGLAADTRLFDHLDLEGFEVIRVELLDNNKSITLGVYAQKVISHNDIQNNSIIIGNSMGGMIAIEIAKIIPVDKVIVISTIKTIEEEPSYFKIFRKIPVYNFVPEKIFKSLDFLMGMYFGKMDQTDIILFKDMLKRWSPATLKWAMGAIVNWDNKIIPPNTYHIVGDKDMVFTRRDIKNATVVKGGTHIMMYDEADKINKILKKIFEDETAPVVLP